MKDPEEPRTRGPHKRYAARAQDMPAVLAASGVELESLEAQWLWRGPPHFEGLPEAAEGGPLRGI